MDKQRLLELAGITEARYAGRESGSLEDWLDTFFNVFDKRERGEWKEIASELKSDFIAKAPMDGNNLVSFNVLTIRITPQKELQWSTDNHFGFEQQDPREAIKIFTLNRAWP